MDSFVGLGGRFMAHNFNRLSPRKVATATKPGMYPDGGGLYLRVGRGGAKSWCLRYMLEGNAREMGLGGFSKVTLGDARKRAAAQRLLLADKVDPLTRRKAQDTAKKIEAARTMTFDDCAQAYLKAHEASWRASSGRTRSRLTFSRHSARYPSATSTWRW
jgi:hypothetical protein